jgi:2-dehydro-3-deoxyphosphooctonate aldolase (KDO 8-P synthase)
METHPKPSQAMSDGPNAVPLAAMSALLETLMHIDRVVKQSGFFENTINDGQA